jgi:hypothetical protein
VQGRGQTLDEFTPFAFESRDLLLHFPRLVKSEGGHR